MKIKRKISFDDQNEKNSDLIPKETSQDKINNDKLAECEFVSDNETAECEFVNDELEEPVTDFTKSEETIDSSDNLTIKNRIRNIIRDSRERGGMVVVVGIDSDKVVDEIISDLYNNNSNKFLGTFYHYCDNVTLELLSIIYKNIQRVDDYYPSGINKSLCGEIGRIFDVYNNRNTSLQGLSEYQNIYERVKNVITKVWNLKNYNNSDKLVVVIRCPIEKYDMRFFNALSKLVNDNIIIIISCSANRGYCDDVIKHFNGDWTPSSFYGHFCGNDRVFYLEKSGNYHFKGCLKFFYDDDD